MKESKDKPFVSIVGFSSSSLLGSHVGIDHIVLVLGRMKLLLDLGQADVCHGIVAIENASNFLEGRALGLDVDKVHPDELESIPNL